MTKIYLATKQEVTVVKNDLTTLNTQINTPSIGIDARIQNLEGKGLEIDRLRVDVDFIEDQIENPTTGILKMISDIDTEINEADTGIKARLTGLEQGGTVTTKFRVHTPSGKYEDGEIVQRNNLIYKANSAIDGTTTPVPFVEGIAMSQWTKLTQETPRIQTHSPMTDYKQDAMVRVDNVLYRANNDITPTQSGPVAFVEGSGVNAWTKVSPTERPNIASHNPNADYKTSDAVIVDKLIYLANSNIIGSSTSVPFVEGNSANQWTMVGGKETREFGDVKSGYQSADHNGWYLMNGRAVSTLSTTAKARATTLGFSSTLPDASGRGIIGAGGNTVGSLVGSNTIVRANLPNVQISITNQATTNNDATHTHVIPSRTVTSGSGTAHTHTAGSLSATSSGSDHSHPISGSLAYISGSFKYDGTGSSGNSGTSVASTTPSTTTSGSHTHTVTGNTGNDSGHTHDVVLSQQTSNAETATHKHSLTGFTDSINGGVAQTAFTPPSIRLNMFIYLGV